MHDATTATKTIASTINSNLGKCLFIKLAKLVTRLTQATTIGKNAKKGVNKIGGFVIGVGHPNQAACKATCNNCQYCSITIFSEVRN